MTTLPSVNQAKSWPQGRGWHARGPSCSYQLNLGDAACTSEATRRARAKIGVATACSGLGHRHRGRRGAVCHLLHTQLLLGAHWRICCCPKCYACASEPTQRELTDEQHWSHTPATTQVHVSAAAVVPSVSGAVRTAAERTVLLSFAPRMAVVTLSGCASDGLADIAGGSAPHRHCSMWQTRSVSDQRAQLP